MVLCQIARLNFFRQKYKNSQYDTVLYHKNAAGTEPAAEMETQKQSSVLTPFHRGPWRSTFLRELVVSGMGTWVNSPAQ